MTELTSRSTPVEVSRWLAENGFADYVHLFRGFNGKAILGGTEKVTNFVTGVDGLRLYGLLNSILMSPEGNYRTSSSKSFDDTDNDTSLRITTQSTSSRPQSPSYVPKTLHHNDQAVRGSHSQKLSSPNVHTPKDDTELPPIEHNYCITIKTRIVHSPCGIRTKLARDLIKFGVGHGFIRRVSTTEVDILIVLPPDHSVDMTALAEYFFRRWYVNREDYYVDKRNYMELSHLNRGFLVYKTAIPDAHGRYENEELHLTSADGFSVLSDTH